jgi:hypothetical protein
MPVANANSTAQTVPALAATRQFAPTIVQALGLDPAALDAVQAEEKLVLPVVASQLAK